MEFEVISVFVGLATGSVSAEGKSHSPHVSEIVIACNLSFEAYGAFLWAKWVLK